ncbi:hypothetical protein HMPREF1337_00083 [Enterococcus faecalis ERV65]|uniref:Uncharacterized protein n=1 Tax=Enterococcus faecalis ERV63 TaxID=1134793 RepID=A0AAV3GKQ9_ENTFL|nr:hypothetical protein HMPREF0348_0414 [Enterococcus faecalis TX0104]EJU89531.1 hypothetical protein HMPREF1329_01085 [Enterococcus faecalis ERV116]EJU95069.1 hypothetical protein HMPREF1330_02343 [Enterococcus faecalis ERV129]EJV06244.1 hypothetical protein HMPREF1334_02850 [Enterococcus faecalis ERV41]EJV07646.1 hypothetical protein HMPREF1333_01379 [Enterococcus faecalis ERV37]EJV16412.1 hypothetical protein HMPREF1336_01755 [Enterococcus faecalis ERV63]EJV22501.1 hypothetical protein HMP
MPYFTLEYRNQQITQIQGKRNRQEVPERIRQTVRQWQERIYSTPYHHNIRQT